MVYDDATEQEIERVVMKVLERRSEDKKDLFFFVLGIVSIISFGAAAIAGLALLLDMC